MIAARHGLPRLHPRSLLSGCRQAARLINNGLHIVFSPKPTSTLIKSCYSCYLHYDIPRLSREGPLYKRRARRAVPPVSPKLRCEDRQKSRRAGADGHDLTRMGENKQRNPLP